MAPGPKKARQEGRSIVLIDESGFMLQPVVRRTWAPQGETPIQYSWDRHDRLSVIAALTVAPYRRRLGLYFQVHERNIRSEEGMAFLVWVHRHLRRPLVVVLDRYSAHRKAVRLLQEKGAHGLEVAWLPAYAPDLNPVEMIWNYTKYGRLANFLPEDIVHLAREGTTALQTLRREPRLKRSFFAHAGLAL